MSFLDLLNTSQTKKKGKHAKKPKTDRRVYDRCQNGAPFFAYQISGKTYGVMQGFCNDWNCPRCGENLAKQHYGRIIVGARHFAETMPLYFLTLTCRGREMTYEEAEAGYLLWTNRLLTRLRTSHKRSGKPWIYASVTERQKRMHPHSHYIISYCPDDAVVIPKGKKKHFFTTGEDFTAEHNTLQSEYLERACVECGLGNQYDISIVETVEGGARYMAKYLFKESIFETVWPDGWRRVRYSHGWPKLPEKEGNAMVLLSVADWHKLLSMATSIVTQDDGVKERAVSMIGYTGVDIQ